MKNAMNKRSASRLLAVAMALVLLMGLVPVSALAATAEVSSLEDLKTAITEATDETEVKVAATLEGEQEIGALSVKENTTILLTGQTLKGSFDVPEDVTLTIKGKGGLLSEGTLFTGSGTVVIDLDGTVTAETIAGVQIGGPNGEASMVTLSLKRGTFEGTIAVPEGKDVTHWVTEGSKYVASEEENTFSVKDETPPVITAGNATRVSKEEALVEFESDEDGTYTYTVTAGGAMVIETDEDEEVLLPMFAGKNTLSLEELPDGALKLALMAKDASGNEIVPFTIDIPEYVPPVYTVTKPTGEGFTFTGEDTVEHGKDYVFTVELKEGYENLKVTVNGEELAEAEDKYTVSAVDKAPEIVITADLKKFAIKTEGEGFTLEPVADKIEYGKDYVFSVKPAEGWKVGEDGLTVSVGETKLTATDGKYTVPAVSAETTIKVEGMEKIVYTITLPTGTGFTVTADSGTNTVEYGKDFAFTVAIDSANGYVAGTDFAVKVGDTTLTSSNYKYTIPAVKADQTVSVSGVSLSHFNIQVSTGGYTITAMPGSKNPAPYGSSYQFKLSLKEGYNKTDDFAVKANGTKLDADSSGVYTVANIRANTTIEIFGVTNGTYKINFSSDASYKVIPQNSSTSPVAYNGSYSFKVEPNPGYVRGSAFSVKKDGLAMSPDANGVYTIYNVKQDHNIAISGVVAASTAVNYSVTLTGGTGYSYTAQNGSVSPVAPGGSYSFKVNIANGYTKGTNFAVKVNGTALTPYNNVYTIYNISSNQTVTVTGVVQTTTNTGTGTTVAAAPAITTTTLPDGAMGTAYSQTLKANGQNITWSYTGSLPNGLTLNTTTGVISGTPTLNGTFRFAVKATNTAGSNTKQLTITVTGEEYKISEGQKAEWTQGSEEGILFQTDSKGTYVKVQVDGKDVAARHVETAENGTGITLKKEYLEELDNGAHTITIVYSDGSAKTTFTVAAEDKTEPPVIVMQPESQTANSGDKITFSVMANGTTPLICQWQVDKNDGNGWQNITGAANASYTITTDTVHNGYKFRCTVTNGAGSVTSDEAILTVTGAEETVPEDENNAETPETGKKSNTWLWITVATVAVVGIAAAAFIVYRNRKYYGD